MATTYTPNYNLGKQTNVNDLFDMSVITDDMDKIDTALADKQDKVLGAWTAGESTTHVTPASTDTVLQALQKIDNNQRNDEANITTEQTKTQGIDSTGDNFIEINGVKLYFGSTTPSNPSDGDWWLD